MQAPYQLLSIENCLFQEVQEIGRFSLLVRSRTPGKLQMQLRVTLCGNKSQVATFCLLRAMLIVFQKTKIVALGYNLKIGCQRKGALKHFWNYRVAKYWRAAFISRGTAWSSFNLKAQLLEKNKIYPYSGTPPPQMFVWSRGKELRSKYLPYSSFLCCNQSPVAAL